MVKVRFAFIALKKYIDSLLSEAIELAEDDADNVRVYQLYFTNYTLDNLKERLSKLKQSIDSEEEAHEEALKEAREE